MRPHIYKVYAEIVTALAKRSSCSSRAAVGALMFDDSNRIIATGYNGTPFGFPHCDEVGCSLDTDGHCINAIHAEENAIFQCAIIGRSTQNLRIFTTHSPCWRCSLRLVQVGIGQVIYLQPYGNSIDKITQLFASYGIHCQQFAER